MPTFRTMTTADIDLGMSLKRQAGWNQTREDWQRFIALAPQGCFIAVEDDRDVATVTTTMFGSVGWIAMVLVDESMRGRGIGKAVLNHAIAHLESQHARSIRLDATPMGRPLYEKLGFVAQFDLVRYAGRSTLAAPLAPVEPMDETLLPEVLALDASVTATPRSALIRTLIEQQPHLTRIVRRDNTLHGYVTARPGEDAAQIGPCIASINTGRALLADALARHAGQQVYIDVPADNAEAIRVVESAGLTPQRNLTRMTRGTPIVEDVARLWASTGPEKG